jgi:hypothetical protein
MTLKRMFVDVRKGLLSDDGPQTKSQKESRNSGFRYDRQVGRGFMQPNRRFAVVLMDVDEQQGLSPWPGWVGVPCWPISIAIR